MNEKRCATCHEMRPLADYNVRRSAPDGLQARCRACAREWYVRNKGEHIRRVTLRNKRVRGEHQERMAEHLLDHPCVDCGEADLRVLELDHEDPAQKTANVGRLLTLALPWPTVVAEIDECSCAAPTAIAGGRRSRTPGGGPQPSCVAAPPCRTPPRLACRRSSADGVTRLR